MNYFMLVWETRNYNSYDDISDTTIRNTIQNHIGKETTIEDAKTVVEDIENIGKDLRMLTGQIPNIVFFETDNCDITDNTIAYWLSQKVGRVLFDYCYEIYIKQVSDPYPLLKLPR